MPERDAAEPFAYRYSESGQISRRELPPDALGPLFEAVDALTADPDGFPGRTRAISRDGRIRLYSHPSPALQITYEVDTQKHVLHVLHCVAPKMPRSRPVFISYAHRDAAWLLKLKEFLQPLEDQELIRVWDDREIHAGSDWLAEIRQALSSARVAVFLVTQNFLSSAFIREREMPALLQAAHDRGCLIFWIAVSSTTFADSPLARIQAANPPHAPLDLLSDAEQNKVLLEIYQKLKAAVTAT
jgi:hypothetical protein